MLIYPSRKFKDNDMDFQFTNHTAQLSLPNGKSLTSLSRKTSSRTSLNRVLYYFELELNQDPVCKQDFLTMKEIDFPEATNISASLLNFEYPNADTVEVEKLNNKMNYDFYITISRQHWLHKTSLYSFIPEFIYALNKSHLSTRLLLEEEFGCYLQTTLQVPATQTIQSRIKSMSNKLAQNQQNVLLNLAG